MDDYIKINEYFEHILLQYNIYFSHPLSYKAYNCKNAVIQHAFQTGNQKDLKKAFFSELKKIKLKKRLMWLKIKDNERFDTFSYIFYKRKGVDIEFARKEICAYLR